jgi:hypothetical protein
VSVDVGCRNAKMKVQFKSEVDENLSNEGWAFTAVKLEFNPDKLGAISCKDRVTQTGAQYSSQLEMKGEPVHAKTISCHAKSCDTAELIIEHGKHDCGDSVVTRQSCTLTCNAGYYVVNLLPGDPYSNHTLPAEAVLSCDAGRIERKSCAPKPCFPNRPAPFVIANAKANTCDGMSLLEHDATCHVFCEAGYTPTGPAGPSVDNTNVMTCRLGELVALKCERPEPCPPGEEITEDGVGSHCSPCLDNFYSVSGKHCHLCPSNSRGSEDKSHCRCA